MKALIKAGQPTVRVRRNQDVFRFMSDGNKGSAVNLSPVHLLRSIGPSAEPPKNPLTVGDGSFEEWTTRCNRLADNKPHQRLMLDGISNAMFRHSMITK